MTDDITPFGGDLPEELRRMLEQLTGEGSPFPGGLPFMQMPGVGGHSPGDGPVDWKMARRAAMQLASASDRSPTDAERARASEALQIAEHWLDTSSLPAPPDAGQLHVASKAEWVDAALTAMRPMVEPVAAAATANMADLARQQMQDIDLEELGLGALTGMLQGMDLGALLEPLGATVAGLQAGQVLGQLAGQLLTGTELGIPTGPRSIALLVAPTIAETFGSWDLDDTEVLIVLCLHEAANRRLFHAVSWLEGHLHDLVATFAQGAQVDSEQLRRMAEEMMQRLDPSDPESMEAAMQSASQLRMTPTPAQLRVLERIQGVVALVGAWTRREVEAAAGDRLPGKARIDEVLRRRRASRGDGDHLLASLLGLDLTPDDPTLGDHFVEVVTDALGPDGLRSAIAHPDNLPDLTELAQPERWLARLRGDDSEVPHDVSSLLDGLGDAPVEESADERIAAARAAEDQPEAQHEDRPEDTPPDDAASDETEGGA
jgi:putative hydrolase